MARTFLTVSLALVFTGAISAQEPVPGTPPAKPPEAKQSEPKAQNPKVQNPKVQDPKAQDPAKAEAKPEAEDIDRVDELKNQLARAKAELEATRELNEQGGLPTKLQPYLAARSLAPRSFDLGIEVPDVPTADHEISHADTAKQTGARVLTDAEIGALAEGVIFTVDGKPVTKGEYDAALTYFAARPGVAPEQAERDTIRALVIQKAALARFAEGAVEAREKMAEIERLLAGGGDFADIAKEHSDCPSAAQGGDLGQFGRGAMDPMFERAAFSTEVGKASGVIQSAFGYHIIKVESHDQGENERVHARHILVMFDDDQNAVRQTFGDAAAGRVDLGFVDEQWMAKSPF